MVLLSSVFLFQFPTNTQATSEYPDKPIQVLVGWSAGASEDMRARGLVPKLQEVLGQPVVVVNKPGAASTIALTLVAKAKPDGYTITHPLRPLFFYLTSRSWNTTPWLISLILLAQPSNPLGLRSRAMVLGKP